ncbi:MAG: ATP synthase F1 subunit delta [Phycisphaeraceae bacterium]|nr:ATP synthase F1 subunit delta [Phycisphaeraceae bacterium]
MPTQVDEIAKVYARSLFELADKSGGEAKIAESASELEAIAELVRGDAKLREFLASPIVERDARGTALRKIFEGRVSELTLRFLLVVNEHDRSGHLQSIADAYDMMVQERFGRIEVDVFTTTGGRLEPAVESAIVQRVKAAFGKEPVLHSYADPAMIGGVKLRVGDQLIDGSVATRLRRLASNLHERGQSGLGRDLSSFLT